MLGIFLTWTLLSLGAMQIQEWTATRLKWRSRMLEKSLGKMLTDVTLLDQFYNHPLIRSLFTGKNSNNKPSYIPASEFSQAMIDLLASNGTEASLLQHELYILYGTAQKLPRQKRIAASERISLLLGMTRKALVNESGEEACREILDRGKKNLQTRARTSPPIEMKKDQKTFLTCSFFPKASSTASVSAFMADRISRGRKTKSGRKRTALPMTASGSGAIPANQNPAGTAMDPARMPAMVTSPTLNHALRSAPSIFSSSVRSPIPNMPMAWSTPHQKARRDARSGIGIASVVIERGHVNPPPQEEPGTEGLKPPPPGQDRSRSSPARFSLRFPVYPSAGTVSAQVSTLLRMASSE